MMELSFVDYLPAQSGVLFGTVVVILVALLFYRFNTRLIMSMFWDPRIMSKLSMQGLFQLHTGGDKALVQVVTVCMTSCSLGLQLATQPSCSVPIPKNYTTFEIVIRVWAT